MDCSFSQPRHRPRSFPGIFWRDLVGSVPQDYSSFAGLGYAAVFESIILIGADPAVAARAQEFQCRRRNKSALRRNILRPVYIFENQVARTQVRYHLSELDQKLVSRVTRFSLSD